MVNQMNICFVPNTGNKLTTNGLATAIKRYNKRRGVNKTSIHLYRHYFAKSWIVNGGDVFTLQRLLNHSDIKMTNEYVNLYAGDLKNMVDRFNPLSNFYQNNNKEYISMKKRP